MTHDIAGRLALLAGVGAFHAAGVTAAVRLQVEQRLQSANHATVFSVSHVF